jgi:putative protease
VKKVGKVTHFYDNIGVVIVELSDTLKVGDKVKFEGHGADFEQVIESLQIDHKPVEKASAGELVGLKTEQRVKEGTEVKKV